MARLGCWTLLWVTLFGCGELENPYRPFPEPPFDEFVSRVQPVAEKHCAFLGCHGTPYRALTVYAVGFLRAPSTFPGAPLDEERLSEVEQIWNYDAFRIRLLDETSAEKSHLLLKCLSPERGGIRHAEDYVVFESTEDPDYVALRDWISEGL